MIALDWVAARHGQPRNSSAADEFEPPRRSYKISASGAANESEEGEMSTLTGKTMVVIGGSRGVGRRIVEAAGRNGAHVLAAARQEAPLRQLAQEVPGAKF